MGYNDALGVCQIWSDVEHKAAGQWPKINLRMKDEYKADSFEIYHLPSQKKAGAKIQTLPLHPMPGSC